MIKLLIINGPNLDMLGKREPEMYGLKTLEDLEKDIAHKFNDQVEFNFFQSNHEGAIIEAIHSAKESGVEGIIINPGAYTHYSIAIHDAIKSQDVPVVEVHISNIYQREEFRQKSVIAPVTIGQISGFGLSSYELAVGYFLGQQQEESYEPEEGNSKEDN